MIYLPGKAADRRLSLHPRSIGNQRRDSPGTGRGLEFPGREDTEMRAHARLERGGPWKSNRLDPADVDPEFKKDAVRLVTKGSR
jgi:hypothetical protein